MGKQWESLPELLTVADLAARYRCSPRTIKKRVDAGSLPAPVDPSARSKQWHPDAIAEYEQSSQTVRSTVAMLSARRVS